MNTSEWLAIIGILASIATGFIVYSLTKRDSRKARIQKLWDDVTFENAKRTSAEADKLGMKGTIAVRENGEVGNDHIHQPINEKVDISENVVAIVNRNPKTVNVDAILVAPPVLEVVNTYPEPSGRNPTLSYIPNFRNHGRQAASNVVIHFKVLDQILGLPDILGLEGEIKKSLMRVAGSIAPTKSINLNDGRLGIEWQKRANPVNVELWFTYEYEPEQEGELIFNIWYNEKYDPVGGVVRYKSSDIRKA